MKNEDIDGGKKVKGHKRHILVDTLSNMLYVNVHAANRSDTKVGCDVMQGGVEKYPSLKAFSGDAGYKRTAVTFTDKTLGMILHISERIEDGWVVQPQSTPCAG